MIDAVLVAGITMHIHSGMLSKSRFQPHERFHGLMNRLLVVGAIETEWT